MARYPDFDIHLDVVDAPDDVAGCRLIYEIGMNTTWERWFSMMELPYLKSRGSGYSHGSMSIEQEGRFCIRRRRKQRRRMP